MSDAEEKANIQPDKDKTIPTASFLPGAATPGGQVGPYKLLSILGEGGFAVVYLAEQQRPVKRRVALKVIKPGMDTKQVIARFEAERQALALLDHPNVAHVYDAGTTEFGRPYFVMEYFKGVPITEHCDRYKLSIEERLELFLQVCEAVQHAHQKGIIHRDIKPSNILVLFEGQKALTKVIDFGVAKAISQPLTDRTLVTEQGQFIGTPEYMSPEQAEMTTQDIDTRSDIYSLGVVLYELLTGVLPFAPEKLREGGVEQIRHTIREEEPKTPSTRLSTISAEESTKLAKLRQTDIRTLAKRLHKELEWIPLKAMRKERTRRYRTASELADDIQNYLNGNPLIAGPESAAYRVRKFVRRNRALITGVVAVLIVLLAGVVVSTIFAFGQVRARAEAERQRMTVEAVVNFLYSGLLASIEPDEAKSREISVLEILDAASEKFGDKFKDVPIVEASIRYTLGITYQKLGNYEAARPHLVRSLAIRREQLGGEHPDTLYTANSLALLYVDQGRYNEAEPLFVKTLEIRRRVLGENHLDTLGSIKNLNMLVEDLSSMGMKQCQAGAYEEAVEILKRVDKHRRTVLKNESQPRDIAYIAMALHKLGREKEAEAALNRLRGLFEDSKHTREENYLYEAEQLFAGKNSKVYHAWERIKAGKLDEATQFVKELRSLKDPNIDGGVDSVTKVLARAYYNRGRNVHYRGGGYAETIADYEAALHIDPNYARAFSDLAYLQAACPADEFRDAGKAVENATKACELTEWKEPTYVDTLAAVYAEVGDFTSAIKWQKEAIALLPKDKHTKWQVNYEARLKLYKSSKPYRMGNLWSFSTGDMVGWWKFDETEGHIAIDSSGNGLEGKLLGDAHFVSDPIRGNVLNLDGDSDYVSCGNSSAYDITGSITIAARIKVNAFNKDWQAIVTKGDSAWRLHRYSNTNFIDFACTGLTGGDKPWVSTVWGSKSVNDGQWHHVAGVYDEKKIYLYVDGVLDNSEDARGTINTNNEPVYIGGNSEEGRRYWNGLINDVRIYNYALDEAQIRTLLFETAGVGVTTPRPANGANVGVTPVVKLGWNPSKNTTAYQVYFGTDPNKMAFLGEVKEDNFIQSPKLEKFQRYYWRVDEERADGSIIKGDLWSFSTANLVGWWNFDEVKDGNVVDSSGFGHHGRLVGDANIVTDAERGSVLQLDGDGDYVLVADIGAHLNGLDALTICLWVKSNATVIDKGFIIFEDPQGYDNRSMRYDAAGAAGVFGAGTNLIKCAVTTDSPKGPPNWPNWPGRQQIESSDNTQTTKWQHLTMTWSSGNLVKLFINGVENTPKWYDPVTVGNLTGYTKLIIGKGGKDIGNMSWNGLIDDVRIYNYALDEAQIRTLLFETAGVGVTTPRPANGANVGVTPVVKLGWNPSKNATAYQVYFGTDPNKMALLGKVKVDNFIQSPKLEKFQRYYWRVDEERVDGPTIKGEVWSFSTANLVGWWNFDEVKDGNVVDSSGFGHHGRLVGDANIVTDAERGSVLQLDGDGDYVDCENHADFDITGEVTVAAWIRLSGQADDQKIAGNQDGRTGGYKMSVLANKVDFEIRDQSNVATLNRNVAGGTILQPGVWYHVVGVYSQGNYIRTYVSGNLDRELVTAAVLASTSGTLKIGREPYDSTGDFFGFKGLIDDVRIYNYALDETQVEALFFETGGVRVAKPWPTNGASVEVTPAVKLSWNPSKNASGYHIFFGTDPNRMALLGKVKDVNSIQSPKIEKLKRYYWRVDAVKLNGSVVEGEVWSFWTANMLGWWNFDEVKDGNVVDSSGFGHHGRLVGDANIVTDAERGSVLQLDGDGDYVDCGNNPVFDITGAITLSCWIKVTKFDKGWQAIVTKGDGAWRLQRDRENNCLQFACTSLVAAGPGYGKLVGKTNVNDGQWHHVCGTFDGSVVRVYVNGVEDANMPYRGSITTNDFPVYIGENAERTGRYWNGLIDDVRIYTYALSPAEIKALFAGKGAAKPSAK